MVTHNLPNSLHSECLDTCRTFISVSSVSISKKYTAVLFLRMIGLKYGFIHYCSATVFSDVWLGGIILITDVIKDLFYISHSTLYVSKCNFPLKRENTFACLLFLKWIKKKAILVILPEANRFFFSGRCIPSCPVFL